MPKTRAQPPTRTRPQASSRPVRPSGLATRGGRRRGAIVLAAITGLMTGLAGCGAIQHAKPFLIGDGCQAVVYGQTVQLDTEQAAIAATIAGVGYQHRVPAAAVTVAFAAALQESKLYNLDYGDRDSVGIFQQRPSEGWGTRTELEDPIFAATKFYAALVKVPGYEKMPVYQAAQAVQHSADGTAYGQYEQVAGLLSMAFTGHAARAVWCWYTPYPSADPGGLAAAGGQLDRTFGRGSSGATLAVPSGPAAAGSPGAVGAPAMTVPVQRAQTGWAISAWLVAHAKEYGIKQIRYAGYQWRASNGQSGWRRDTGATARHVLIS